MASVTEMRVLLKISVLLPSPILLQISK